MSYILNALKKAENKSFGGENLKVKKQILILKRQTRGGKLKILLLISGLLGTLLLGGWLGYMQTGQTEQPVAATKSQGTPDHDPIVPSDHQPVLVQDRLTSPVKTADEIRSESIQNNRTNAKSSGGIVSNIREINPPIPVRTMAVTPKAQAEAEEVVQPVAKQKVEEDTEPGLQSYADIPLKIRQKLPSLKISLHFYNSVPEKRLVRINGRNLHEGDWIEEGLAVEEIKPTTTVLNHDGYLFELNAPGG
ncbi:general secretion pathway protein GspB [uncultured Desulfuromusa sp.]|uniref:general secretion pathway protein GspB n=1 Tax=uncultured Desulfuromusa sp. TaxID=219183 RepID=UPI002AA66D9C|nr:general secretion pathway protein GspB [uncultured Desulfuromusa sp.]